MLSGEGTREEGKVKLGHPTPDGTLALQFYQVLYTGIQNVGFNFSWAKKTG